MLFRVETPDGIVLRSPRPWSPILMRCLSVPIDGATVFEVPIHVTAAQYAGKIRKMLDQLRHRRGLDVYFSVTIRDTGNGNRKKVVVCRAPNKKER